MNKATPYIYIKDERGVESTRNNKDGAKQNTLQLCTFPEIVLIAANSLDSVYFCHPLEVRKC